MKRDRQYRMTCVVKPAAKPMILEAMDLLKCENVNQFLKMGIREMVRKAQEIKQQNVSLLSSQLGVEVDKR